MEKRQTGVTFTGGALASFGYLAIFLFLFVLIIPGAWGAVPFAVWWAASLSFDDGTRAEFTGRAGQIWVMFAVLSFLSLLPYIASIGVPKGNTRLWTRLLFKLVLIPCEIAIIIPIYRWFIESIRLSPGVKLRFTGNYLPLLGWEALNWLSAITIIGPFWVVVARMRWICRHIESDAYTVQFTGTGWGLLWRSFIWIIGMVCIIPLPWVTKSATAWWTNNLVLTRAAAPAIEDDFPVYGTA